MSHVKAKPPKPAPALARGLFSCRSPAEPRRQKLIWGAITLKSSRDPWAPPSLSFQFSVTVYLFSDVITGLCLVILHPAGSPYWQRPRPVSVCLRRRGTSLFPKLQADNLFAVFYPKSAVRDSGNSPSQTWARLPAPSLPSARQPAPARRNKLPTEPGRGNEGSRATWLPAPTPAAAGTPTGKRSPLWH